MKSKILRQTNTIRLIWFFVITLVVCNVFGQNTMPVMPNVTPVSPNAASLGKYGEVPVGYSTGVPSISVPIYEINTGSLKVPISVSYHAGGVKVEDIASWVGLGWSLNAGVTISRQARGNPDESSVGYLNDYADINRYINNQMSSNDKQAYLEELADGYADSQQDIFFYSAGNESGKFIFDSTGSVLTIPLSKNKFEFGTFYGVSETWKITDVNGNQYFFTYKETTASSPVTNGSLSSHAPPVATTTWYVSKIINTLGTDSITFIYDGVFNQFSTIGSQTKYILHSEQGGQCNFKNPDESYALNTTNGYRLSEIIFKNGSVKFNESATRRCDYPSDYALASIEINNTDSSFFKKFLFYQSYTTTNQSSCDTNYWQNSRMFLDSIEILDLSTSISKYKFDYNKENTLPSTRSYNQDHWGFYNGASNYELVPTTNWIRGTGDIVIVSGADRNPNVTYAKAGILKSITYPTGGRTEFEYEGNTANNLEFNQDIVIGYGYLGYNGSNTTVNQSFTVGDYAGMGGTSASISVNMGSEDCSTNQSFGCPIVTLDSDPVLSSVPIFLSSGSHQLVIDLSYVTDQDILDNFSFQITWVKGALAVDTLRYDMPVGGLRIKKITDLNSDGSKAMVKKYKYNLPDSAYHSSGNILSFPRYLGSMLYTNNECLYTSISASSNYALSTFQNSAVQYQYVEELLGENGEFGKNRYEFVIPSDMVYTSFPYAPAQSADWKRGQLLHEKNYRFNNTSQTYELIKEKINTYAANLTNNYQGLKVGENEFHDEIWNSSRTITAQQYSTVAGWLSLIGQTEKNYDQKNLSQYVEASHSFGYGSNHFMPIKDSTSNSKGEVVITTIKYPLDYTGLSGTDAFTAGIQNLKNKNVVSPVIETFTQIQSSGGSNNRYTNALITTYKTDKPLPDTIWAAELNTGSTTFTASSVSSGSITKSSLYKSQVLFNQYNSNGNILQQQKLNGEKHSYIWDYLNSSLIAECTNADSTSIAFTSFEAEGKGNWSFSGSVTAHSSAPTGSKGYSLSGGNITKTGLNSSETYTVTYWKRDSSSSVTVNSGSGTLLTTKNGWKLYKHEITSSTSITVSGTAYIDELRLYPSKALMTTYTYVPLVGISSQCDANNRITYYEYDDFGRLKRIKDEDGRILKLYDYKYQVGYQQ
jgi:YD repeat-containing protein